MATCNTRQNRAGAFPGAGAWTRRFLRKSGFDGNVRETRSKTGDERGGFATPRRAPCAAGLLSVRRSWLVHAINALGKPPGPRRGRVETNGSDLRRKKEAQHDGDWGEPGTSARDR